MGKENLKSQKVAFIFPGQGSQYVGMGNNLYERFDNVKKLYDNVNGILGFDLRRICHHGPADELNKDIIAQIAVYVNNYIHLMLLSENIGPIRHIRPIFYTGYSLGFYSALVAGGAIDFATGLAIVKEAEKLMEEETGSRKGGMVAIIGLLIDDMEAICNEARKEGDVWISNVNAARQIIVSGMDEGLRAAERLALERGALHVVPINVGLPFHTPLMKRAGERFYEYLKTIDIKDSEIPVISYMNGKITRDKNEIRKLLSEQLYHPVRWKETVLKMVDSGIDTFIEVGPERALTRMTQWTIRAAKIMATEDILSNGVQYDIKR